MATSSTPSPSASRAYRIVVEGKIDASWSDWLGGLAIVCRKEADGMLMTEISGALRDQAALRGLLNRLWDLNLVLRCVLPLDQENESKNA